LTPAPIFLRRFLYVASSSFLVTSLRLGAYLCGGETGPILLIDCAEPMNQYRAASCASGKATKFWRGSTRPLRPRLATKRSHNPNHTPRRRKKFAIWF